jgi:hypothetical protein
MQEMGRRASIWCRVSPLTVLKAPHLFGRERHVMGPYALEIAVGDFALAAGHRRTAINLLAGTLCSAAAFSTASRSSAASTSPAHVCLAASL